MNADKIAEERELQRVAVLVVASAAARLGMTAETLHTGVVLRGYRCDLHTVREHLIHLEDKGLMSAHAAVLSAGNIRYRLTAAGREYLEGQGLI